MRVLHLLGVADDVGGILTVIRNLQTVTPEEGCEHVAWVNRAYEETRRPALDYRFTRHLIAESPNHLRLLLGAVRSMSELRGLLAKESFDILHAHHRGSLLVAAIVAVFWRRPVLFSNHAYARRFGLYRWCAGLQRMRTTLLTPNMGRHYGIPIKPGKVEIVSECCDDHFFDLPLPRDPRAPDDTPLRLVGLGNIVRWKNWHLLLQATARLSSEDRARLEFHHWGSVPSDPACRDYEVELKTLAASDTTCACEFHGLSLSVDQPLRHADWFVLPSTNEPCSVALIEALAMGIPVVVSSSGGNVDIVKDSRTGLLFEPENVRGLAELLRRILRGEPRLATSAEIRESVRERSTRVVAGQYLRIYDELAPTTSRPAPE